MYIWECLIDLYAKDEEGDSYLIRSMIFLNKVQY